MHLKFTFPSTLRHADRVDCVGWMSADDLYSIREDHDKLPNLKCFSLKSIFRFQQFDKILSLLCRMPYLENLTLYVRIAGQNRIIDGTFVQNDILFYMPQLYSFTFYISTDADTRDLSHELSREGIQKTWINIGRRNATSIKNYVSPYKVVCSIFSLTFAFDYLVDFGNIFPDIVFSHVTYLLLRNIEVFKHEFFVRIARSFPLLKYLRIFNIESQLLVDHLTLCSDHTPSYSMVGQYAIVT